MKNIFLAMIPVAVLIVSFAIFGISKTLFGLLMGMFLFIVFGLSYLLISEWSK